MDSLFITQYFDWNPTGSRRLQALNRLLAGIGTSTRLTPAFTGYMTTIEQRINLFHLLSQVLAYDVPGAIVEVGVHEGVTAFLLMNIMRELAPGRVLHLYDAFIDPSEAIVCDRFQQQNLPMPILHRGWLHETLPTQAPEQVAFVHIDLGPGRSPETMADDIGLALTEIYPRMSPGAIGVLQDYCDPAAYDRPGFRAPSIIGSSNSWNLYPQVKQACDKFFSDKPERMFLLYAGGYSHGYFRRQRLPRQSALPDCLEQ